MTETIYAGDGGTEVSSRTTFEDLVKQTSIFVRTAVSGEGTNPEVWRSGCDICGAMMGDQCRPHCQWEPYIVIYAMA